MVYPLIFKNIISFVTTDFTVLAAFIIVMAAIAGTCLGYDSFVKDVGFLAAGYLFGKPKPSADAPQSKSDSGGV